MQSPEKQLFIPAADEEMKLEVVVPSTQQTSLML